MLRLTGLCLILIALSGCSHPIPPTMKVLVSGNSGNSNPHDEFMALATSDEVLQPLASLFHQAFDISEAELLEKLRSELVLDRVEASEVYSLHATITLRTLGVAILESWVQQIQVAVQSDEGSGDITQELEAALERVKNLEREYEEVMRNAGLPNPGKPRSSDAEQTEKRLQSAIKEYQKLQSEAEARALSAWEESYQVVVIEMDSTKYTSEEVESYEQLCQEHPDLPSLTFVDSRRKAK